MGKLKALSSLKAFAPALLEILLLRRWAHATFGTDLLQLGVHASDVYLPLSLGLCFLFLMAQKKNPLPIAVQPAPLVLNLSLLLSAFVVYWKSDALRAAMGPDTLTFLFMSLGLFALLTSFFVLLPWRGVIAKMREERARTLYALFAAQLLVAYPFVLERGWKPMAMWTGQSAYHLLNAVGIWVQKPLLENSLRLWNPNFSAYMNMGCSGLEGIFFFLSGFVLVSGYEGRALNVLRTIALCSAGCLMMFALNVFRISAFFAGAVLMEKHLADERGKAFFEWLFHANAGWVLYLLGMWWFFNRWVIRPTQTG
jgi:exosortase/archaeosortase family protein